jgi:hypothetical protein
MYRRLRTMKIDERDDGSVTDQHNVGEEAPARE